MEIRPSSMARILACPGHLALSEGMPDLDDQQYASQGTKAHEQAAYLLSPEGQKLTTSEIEGEYLPEVLHYVGLIEEMTDCYFLLEELVEKRLDSETIQGFGGTPDYVALYIDEHKQKVCHVFDFKSGSGVLISAKGNEQLLSYCVLLKERWPDVDLFRVTIIQPNAYTGDDVSEDQHLPIEVEAFRNRIKEAIGRDDIETGDHCQFCRAKIVCPKLDLMVDTLNQKTASDFDKITNVQLRHWALYFHNRAHIRKMLDECERALLHAMKHGRKVPGLKAIKKMGNTTWKHDETKTLRLLRKFGIMKKHATTAKLKSPTQLKREGYGQVVKQLSERQPIGVKLVPESAGGESVDLAADEFKGIESEVDR